KPAYFIISRQLCQYFHLWRRVIAVPQTAGFLYTRCMQPEQPQAQTPMPVQAPAPQPQSFKKKWLVVGAVAAVLALSVGGWLLFKPGDGGKLSRASVLKMDKTATFWQYFKNAAMQQKLVVIHASLSEGGKVIAYSKIGFDYSTKKIEAAHELS